MSDLIDVRTLLFAITLALLTRAAIMAYVWHLTRYFVPLRYWAIGSGLIAAGSLLVGLRDAIPPFVSVFVAQTLVLGGWLILNGGTVLAAGQRPHWRAGILLLLLGLAGCFWFLAITPNLAMRTVAVSLPPILFDLYAAQICWRYRDGPLKTTLRILAVLLFAMALSNAFKTAHFATHDIENMFLHDPVIGQFFVISLLSSIASTVLLVLLGTQNLQARLDIELAERSLREASMQQANLVYQATNEGMIVMNARRTITSVNPAFSRLTGYPPQEVIGHKPFFLTTDQGDPLPEAPVWKGLAEKGEWQGEVWSRHQAGHLFAEWLSLTTLYDSEGQVRQHIALFHDITEQKRAADTIFRQANFDQLTGLANRNYFFSQLARSLSHARRTGRRIALYFMDLDRFKPVNDQFGHEAGDFVLKTVAGRWKNNIRHEDTLARLGGDEFALIASDIDDDGDLERIARKLIAAQAESIKLPSGVECQVGSSVGIAVFPDQAQEMDSLVAAADEAMYRHKASGHLTIPGLSAPPVGDDPEHPWIVFDAGHLLGVAVIDGQHLQLVEMANNVNRALIQHCDDATAKALFDEMLLYTAHHFATEEAYMKEHHYPHAESHIREHAGLVLQLQEIMARFEPGDELRTLQTIKDWLLHHIHYADKPLGDFLKRHGVS